MAANDYYNSSYQSSAAHPHRTDAPLPPVPGSHSQASVSPVASPFDDHNGYSYPSTQNLAQHAAPLGYDDTSYHGGGPTQHKYGPSHGTDPFADQNAIPMHEQRKGSHGAYDADPERRGGSGGVYRKREKKKKGWFSGRVTWAVYVLTIVQVGVFVGELIKNGMLTGTPIQLKPRINPMIGPSPYVLINMGARYPPCMHNVRGVSDTTDNGQPWAWPCPWSTSENGSLAENQCALATLCGFGGARVPVQVPIENIQNRSHEPDQWWRFIVPMFLHAGIIHILFNMLLQVTLGRDMEKEIGTLRFVIVYFSSGIFGFVLGANYAAPNTPSVGASGSLFGILALVLLDLLYNWGTRRSPIKDLLFLLLDIGISFVLGLLPGLDNFSHIGGFLMGLVLGICLLHSPAFLRERIGVDEPPYSSVSTAPGVSPGLSKFAKQPVGFFKGRKPLWWAWWLARAGALVAVFIGFILLLKNFYEWRNECSWCHHLTCLPVSNWCDVGNFHLSNTTNATNATSSRMMMERDVLLGPVDLAAALW